MPTLADAIVDRVVHNTYGIELADESLRKRLRAREGRLARPSALQGRYWLMGVGPFLLVQAPVVIIGASIAAWFFYVQHQFEDTLWVHDRDWNFHKAALHGSSHYELPPALAWFTGNIGGHHVHQSFQPHPFLSTPAGASRSSAIREPGPVDVSSELAMRDALALGREAEAACIDSRIKRG